MNAEHNERDELAELLDEESSKTLILEHNVPRPVHPGDELEHGGKRVLFIPIGPR